MELVANSPIYQELFETICNYLKLFRIFWGWVVLIVPNGFETASDYVLANSAKRFEAVLDYVQICLYNFDVFIMIKPIYDNNNDNMKSMMIMNHN